MIGNSCERVAVIMSVYRNDKLVFLKESVTSILEQTYPNIDFFINIDGSVSDDIDAYLNEIKFENVFVHRNIDNKGLAFNLNQMIKKLDLSNYCYIARMDADDVSISSRIYEQVEFLRHNSSISVVGSDVVEIDNNGNTLFYKRMEPSHDIMLKNIIKRCPLNHPTVMFRSDVFLNPDLRYKNELLNTQDYYLWVDMFKSQLKFANINKGLLKFRVDENFHKRRGLKKAINDFNSRIYAFRNLRNLTLSNIIHVLLLFLLRLSPEVVKKFAYNKIR
ncbi:MAG: glycosyltransferase [Vibrio litoralis]|uniref:glycosyltransferase n=1 Tax=Vibrio litoralis TaxID=335972 RepID=UPI003F9D9E19